VLWFLAQAYPVEALMGGASLIGFCAALFISSNLLWLTLWRNDERKWLPGETRKNLRTLLLLLSFAWAFICLRYWILCFAGDTNLRVL
jgi:hypothetical protein